MPKTPKIRLHVDYGAGNTATFVVSPVRFDNVRNFDPGATADVTLNGRTFRAYAFWVTNPDWYAWL